MAHCKRYLENMWNEPTKPSKQKRDNSIPLPTSYITSTDCASLKKAIKKCVKKKGKLDYCQHELEEFSVCKMMLENAKTAARLAES